MLNMLGADKLGRLRRLQETACGPSEQWGPCPPYLPRLSGLLQGLHLECQQARSCLAESGGRGLKRFVFPGRARVCSFLAWNVSGVGLGDAQPPSNPHFLLPFPLLTLSPMKVNSLFLDLLCLPY